MTTTELPLSPAYLRGLAKDNRQWAREYTRAHMPEVAAECIARAKSLDDEAARIERETETPLGAVAGFVGIACVFVVAAGFLIGTGG